MTSVTGPFNQQLAKADMSEVYESLTKVSNDELVDKALQSLHNIINLPNKDFTADLVGKGIIENFLKGQLERSAGLISTESMILVTAIFDTLSQTAAVFNAFSY